MKKIVSVFLTICLVASFAVTANAQDTQINQDSSSQIEVTPVSAAVAPTFTVTIPETVKLNETATITASDVLTEAEKAVKVTLSGTDQTNNTLQVSTKNGAAIQYQIMKAGQKPFILNDSLLFETDGAYALSFEQLASSQVFAGDYTGTVTFTVSYETINRFN